MNRHIHRPVSLAYGSLSRLTLRKRKLHSPWERERPARLAWNHSPS